MQLDKDAWSPGKYRGVRAMRIRLMLATFPQKLTTTTLPRLPEKFQLHERPCDPRFLDAQQLAYMFVHNKSNVASSIPLNHRPRSWRMYFQQIRMKYVLCKCNTYSTFIKS